MDAVNGRLLESDDAVGRREDRVIGAAPGISPRMDTGSPLPNDDAAGRDELAVSALDAQPLPAAVSSVFTASAAAGHMGLPLLRDEVVDFQNGQALTRADLPRISLASFLLERDGFRSLDLIENLGFHLGSRQGRRTHLKTGAVVIGENGRKPDDGSLFGGQGIDPDDVAFPDEVLPAAILNDCIRFHEPP